MTAEIISIGTELLLGHIINTNTAFLSQKLAEAGIDVYYTSVVGDNPERITSSIRQAIGRSDIVITTGGLGPTVDDVTIETVAALIGKKLVLNKMVLKCLRDYFKFKKIKMPEATLRQAYTPEGVKCVRNKVGTAPGLLINWKDKVIICLPGPPRELEPMVVDDIVPYLMSRDRYVRRAHFSAPYHGPSTLRNRTIKITGLAESMVNKAVKDLLELKPPTTVGIYAKLDEVNLRIMAKAGDEKSAAKAIGKIETKIRSRLKDYIFGYDDETLEGSVGAILTARKKTIAV
ncbi:MAG: molybdopterin-binding protein, partial [Candidatus Omnitrophica bacterium]|nr:molybdopterin-binding protein [Candidatus Omnitrophota bacterium]